MLAITASSYRRKGDEEASGGAEDEDEDIAVAGGAGDDDEGIGGGAEDDDEGTGPEGEEDEDGSVRVGAGKISVRKSVCLPLCFPDSRKVTLSSASRLRREASKDGNVEEDGEIVETMLDEEGGSTSAWL